MEGPHSGIIPLWNEDALGHPIPSALSAFIKMKGDASLHTLLVFISGVRILPETHDADLINDLSAYFVYV